MPLPLREGIQVYDMTFLQAISNGHFYLEVRHVLPIECLINNLQFSTVQMLLN